MSEPAVHVLVFDGFADWEPSYALAQIRQTGAAPVVSVGLSHHPVRSMGGLTVMPDVTVEQIAPEQVRLFILPGGDQWETAGLDARLVSLLEGCMANGAPLAAICAATTAVARAGLLHGRAHTSNGLEYLKAQVPDYIFENDYVDQLAVRDRGLITASGLGAVEFAREIFAELEVFSEGDLEMWYRMFKYGQ
ncbi:MAG TPA: type 1 glutamine amidotransferase family protein [Gemmatimonadales bacterium]|nr:type 1 glutamine amidotransferase family protein [Gemmatimonadales bacterium]